MTKSIALVSYHFMNVTAAGQSTAKVARALTDAGHRVTVFTADNNWFEGELIEPGEGPLAGISIQRIAAEPNLLPRTWRALAKRDGSSWLWNRLAAIPNLYRGSSPDQWSWVLAAVERFRRVAASTQFDLLLTRLNHFASHYVGLEVQESAKRLPWVAYFSDPWPFHHYPAPYHSAAGRVLKWRLDGLLDRILDQANSAIFPSTHQQDLQLTGHRRRFLEKAVIAPHIGNIWHQAAAKQRGEILRILHAGFLMKERRTDALFDGARALLARRPELRGVLKLEFIGRYADNQVPAPAADLQDVIVFHRYQRPEDIWSWLQAADVLMLVEADMEVGIFFPSKLADYLGAERPILALSPAQGVANDLLGNGPSRQLLAHPNNALAIEQALENAVDAWQQDRLADLAPRPEAHETVTPDRVVACYDRAFTLAETNAGASSRQGTTAGERT